MGISRGQSVESVRRISDINHSNCADRQTFEPAAFVPHLAKIILTIVSRLFSGGQLHSFNVGVARDISLPFNNRKSTFSSSVYQRQYSYQNPSILEAAQQIFRTITYKYTSCAAAKVQGFHICYNCNMYQTGDTKQQISNLLQMRLKKEQRQSVHTYISSNLFIKDIPSVIMGSTSSSSAPIVGKPHIPCARSESFFVQISCSSNAAHQKSACLSIPPQHCSSSVKVRAVNFIQKVNGLCSKALPNSISSHEGTQKISSEKPSEYIVNSETDANEFGGGAFTGKDHLPQITSLPNFKGTDENIWTDHSTDDDSDGDVKLFLNNKVTQKSPSLFMPPHPSCGQVLPKIRKRNISECSDESFICFIDTADSLRPPIDYGSASDSDINNTSSSSNESEDENEEDELSIQFREQSESTLGKKVRFNLKPKIHVMRAWDFAYRSARKGIWEQCARDRSRFQQRILRAAAVLEPILNTKHRSTIYETRFMDLQA